jgi:phage terminase large subunit-like protein
MIEWIEKYLFVPEGRWIGEKIILAEWQKHEIRKIYDNPARTRRAIISFGRKNGKTSLAAMLLLAHLCGPEAVKNSQLYSRRYRGTRPLWFTGWRRRWRG